MNIPQLSKMICNFNNQLQYLTLEIKYCIDSKNKKLSSMILIELSKSLPPFIILFRFKSCT